MDMWMFPGLLMLHPSIARTMVNYRLSQLAVAKLLNLLRIIGQKFANDFARRHNYEGICKDIFQRN